MDNKSVEMTLFIMVVTNGICHNLLVGSRNRDCKVNICNM